MCNSREEAEAVCQKLYGHDNVGQGDYFHDDGHYYRADDGHYYRAKEDLVWIIPPDAHDPGVLGIRDGAKPICMHADVSRESGR